ncbi:right-handed parallel beta-helix repeat-containing protein [Sphingobacterium sp. WOUb80]|uniref:right-handed parallel beta-helix repeat-containing protein n=1 Tax=Sphingobacterium sp. WOUb80 TaxID=3234028 RepID=UPI003CE7239E
MANQFLIKNTMQDMKNLSAIEIDGLKGNNPIYAGVELLGYYEKGDTPESIIYYYVDMENEQDPGPSDDASIVEISGNKLVHKFLDRLHVQYFGVSDMLPDNTSKLNKCIAYADTNNLIIIIPNNGNAKYMFNGSINILANTKIIGNKSYLTYSGDDVFIKCKGTATKYLYPNIQDLIIEKLNRDNIGIGMHVTYTRNNGQFTNITYVGWDLAVKYGDNLELSFLSTFSHCRFTNNKKGIVLLKESNGVTIERCFFDNNSEYAIAVTQRASSINILNCELENNGRQAGGCAILLDEAQAVLIQGNYCENNGFTDGLSPIIKFSSDTGLDTIGVFITNNYFNVGTVNSEGKIGIQPYKTQDLYIGNNRFYGTTHSWDIDFSLGSNTKIQGFGNSFSSTSKINLPAASLSGLLYDATNNQFYGTQLKLYGNNTKLVLTDRQNNNSSATIDLLNDRLRIKNQADIIFSQFDGKTKTVRIPITYVANSGLPATPYADGELAFDTTGDILRIAKNGEWKAVNTDATLIKRGIVYQAAAVADTTNVPSTTYAQSEVHGILTELRELKATLRIAGILAT